MAENIGNIYPTKLPDYDDPADIKEALRLYHYGAPSSGTGAYNPDNSDPSQILPNSIAGYLKAINTSIVDLQNEGYGSIASTTEPANKNNGYVWLDLDSSAPVVSVFKEWKLETSGNLTGSSINISGLSSDRIFVVLKDWSHNDNTQEVKLAIRFNNDLGPNYVNTGGLISTNALYSPDFANTATHDLTISIDLANTPASLKPVSTIADISDGQYFGYYKNTSAISSIQLSLSPTANFDAGTYEVWSYKI